jgi:hypothetical protein
MAQITLPVIEQRQQSPGLKASNKQQCLTDTFRNSLRLHILAPLPTTAPESAGLCALGLGLIVSPVAEEQRSGLVARVSSRKALPFAEIFRLVFMVVMRRASSGAPFS